jgi:hypothetical protein
VFFFFDGVCASVLAAADFDSLLVRPSVNVFDAAVAAGGFVCFLVVPVCDSALAAADFDVLPVDSDDRVCDALVATDLLVVFVFFFAMILFLDSLAGRLLR